MPVIAELTDGHSSIQLPSPELFTASTLVPDLALPDPAAITPEEEKGDESLLPDGTPNRPSNGRLTALAE
jgi:hypothetical protein